jgi:mycoredoxin
MTHQAPPAGSVTMFSTSWCGYCTRLKAQMGREGIAFREIDVEHHPDSAAFVRTVNEGNQTVPTLLFPDGSVATNPSVREVARRLG